MTQHSSPENEHDELLKAAMDDMRDPEVTSALRAEQAQQPASPESGVPYEDPEFAKPASPVTEPPVQQITKQNFIRLGITAFKEHELREIVEVFCRLPGIAPQPSINAQCAPGDPVAWQYRVMFDKGHVLENAWCEWHQTSRSYYEKCCAEIASGNTRLQARPLYALTSTDGGGA